MSYQDFLLQQATITSRAEKACMRRMSRKASIRRAMRAVGRKGQRREDYRFEG